MPALTKSGKSPRRMDTKLMVAAGARRWVAASKGVHQDPKGSFTCGTPEAHNCLPQVAIEAGELVERPVKRGEAGELEERLVRCVETTEPKEKPVRRGETGGLEERPVRSVEAGKPWGAEEASALVKREWTSC